MGVRASRNQKPNNPDPGLPGVCWLSVLSSGCFFRNVTDKLLPPGKSRIEIKVTATGNSSLGEWGWERLGREGWDLHTLHWEFYLSLPGYHGIRASRVG